MAPRTVHEWTGRSPGEAIPPRVRLRVFERAKGRCEACDRLLRPGDKWEIDHNVALINGGENRESNLACLCAWCHKAKTRSDVAEKAVTARKKKAMHGMKTPKGPPMPGTRRSKWRKKINGEVERR